MGHTERAPVLQAMGGLMGLRSGALASAATDSAGRLVGAVRVKGAGNWVVQAGVWHIRQLLQVLSLAAWLQ